MGYRFTERGSTAQIVIIVILVVALVGALGYIYWQNFVQKNQSVSDAQTAQEQADSETREKGTITGSLTYPSEAIPEGIVVHARNLDTDEEYSTSEHLSGEQYTYGVGYSLQVPAGRYYVYGTLDSIPGYKAYYNKVIECGIRVECTDTTNIEVTVKSGEQTSNIMVGDWWSN